MQRSQDLTGNDYISIPRIDRDGAMDGINVLHAAMAGLIEWTGDDTAPLFRPVIHVDGTAVDLTSATWRRTDRWLPAFSLRLDDDSELSGVICAPAGYPAARGFLLRVEFENRGRAQRSVELRLDVNWAWSRHWIASGRPLAGPNTIAVHEGVVTLETDGGRGPALAVSMLPAAATLPAPATAVNGTTLAAHMSAALGVGPKARESVTCFVGCGRERDGAIAAARQMRRYGSGTWLRQTRLELSHTLRAAQTNRWSDALNRNLLFNRYYAVGRAIDDDRLYLIRSRSTLCDQPGLFNEVEALFWTMPALILADPMLAREAILRVLDLHSERSGEHTRYLDGGAFDAGFVFDQFLLYPWLIDTYVTSTRDVSLHDEPLVRQIVMETDAGAFTRLHPQHVLGATDLLPSGEPADYPYATMANVLLNAFCTALDRLPWPESQEQEANPDDRSAAATPVDMPPRMAGAGAEVAAALWRYCVTEVNGEPMLASSTDVAGAAAVYDDPNLSLALLPLFGLCDREDPVWRGTMEFLRSPQYPLWRDGVVPGIAGRSDPARAMFAALCADLHGPDSANALERLLGVTLPAGVAAAGYDPADGSASSPHHAALAGFLAWSLVRVTEPAARQETRRKRRR